MRSTEASMLHSLLKADNGMSNGAPDRQDGCLTLRVSHIQSVSHTLASCCDWSAATSFAVDVKSRWSVTVILEGVSFQTAVRVAAL